MTRNVLIRIAFTGYWAAGTGLSRGRVSDTRCHRDEGDFPCMPMSEVRGTLRETAERFMRLGLPGWDEARVTALFGSRTPDRTDQERKSGDDAGSTPGGLVFHGEARVPESGCTDAAKDFRQIESTAIGASGAALDRTLRSIEVALPVALEGRIEWIGDPDEAWVEDLARLAAATTAFGKGKSDGLGAATAEILHLAGGPAGQGTPPPVTSRRARLVLRQTEPAVFSARAATQGTHETLRQPTGSALMGWAAAAGPYKDFAEPFAVFHSGAVRITDAMPVASDNSIAFPMPKLLMKPKDKTDKEGKDKEAAPRIDNAKVRVGRPYTGDFWERDDTEDDHTQHVEIAGAGRPHVTATGYIPPPATARRLRTATEDGRASEGQLFGYEMLDPGGERFFVARIEADPDLPQADWEKLLAAFHHRTVRLGRARAAGYGGAFAALIEDEPNPGLPDLPAGTTGLVRVLALSDLALVDRDGNATDRPEGAMFGLGDAAFAGGDSALRFRRFAPWNMHLASRDIERQTIEAGSVLAFRLAAPLATALPGEGCTGLWQEAGFGRFLLEPAFLGQEACEKVREVHPAFDGTGAPMVPLAGKRPEVPAAPVATGEAVKPGETATANPDARIHVLRITLEAVTPLSIGSGDAVTGTREVRQEDGTTKPEPIHAAALVRDPSGLPCLPGPGYQGVLRRLWEREHDEASAKAVFGFAGRDGTGQAGRLLCGWGHAQDSKGHAGPHGEAGDDEVLKCLMGESPLWRDHVALGSRHAVEGRRKFARTAVPRGTRFTLEIRYWPLVTLRDKQGKVTRWHVEPQAEVEARLDRIAALFAHPLFRLGGATGRGYGRVKLLCASRTGLDPLAFAATGKGKDVTEDAKAAGAGAKDLTIATLTFLPEALIRLGGATDESKAHTPETHGARGAKDGKAWSPAGADLGEPEKDSDRKDGKPRDNQLRLLEEPEIDWSGNAATLRHSKRERAWFWPVPGSSLKGPVAHRAVFHARKDGEEFVDAKKFGTMTPEEQAKVLENLKTLAKRPEALQDLLGMAKEGQTAEGRAGRVLFEDGEVTGADWVVALDHVGIDRFTGGARSRSGLLFAEEALWSRNGLSIAFRLLILDPEKPGAGTGWPADAVRPFLHALHDLCTGRLALGSRSHGFGTGTLAFKGSRAEAWTAEWTAVRNEEAGS